MGRTILHCDMNNFYASVECMLNMKLRDKPVAVGGDVETRHGIILAKNMIAKKLGVKTGEAIWEAKLKAPNLVTVPPDFRKYLKFSRLARQILYDYTDQIEPFGIDENWIDVTGSKLLCGDGSAIANSIRTRIKEELGITASIGVSFNKIFAKLGSDMKKPDAVTVIPHDKFKDIVWQLPVSELLYVGRSTQRKLKSRGILTIGDLANYPVEYLVSTLGKWGEILYLFANGKDTAPVRKLNESSAVKSIGNGTTCPRDLVDNQDVKLVFTVLSESVATRLRDYGLKCTGVQIYLRDNKLYSITRQKKIKKPTYLSTDIIDAAMELLVNSYDWQNPLRSVGVRAIDLVTENSYMELSLFDDNEKVIEYENLAHTIDSLRKRFGHDSILRASCLLDSSLTDFNPKEDHTIHPVSYFR